MRVAIELADMTHERGKRARVGIACGAAERRQPFGAAAVEKLDTREPLRVQLYPSRHITRIRILPAPEPEQHETHLALARSADEAIDQSKVELAFFRLEEFPVNRRQ